MKCSRALFALCLIVISSTLFAGCKSEPEADAEPLAGMRREVYFRVGADKPLVFPAAYSAKDVRLISMLEVEGFSLTAEYLYGIELRLMKGDKTLFKRTTYERTRNTRIEQPDGELMQDTVDPDDLIQVTDRRLTDVYLTDAVEKADRLEVRLVEPKAGVAYVRMYEMVERDEEKARSQYLRMSDEKRSKRMDIKAMPPSMIEDEEKADLLRNYYRPIAPNGVAGKEYRSHVFLLREEPISYRDYLYGQAQQDFLIGNGRAYVINACGKGTVRAIVKRTPVRDKQETRDVQTLVVSEQTGVRTVAHRFEADANEAEFRVPLSEQCHTLTFRYPYAEEITIATAFLEAGMAESGKNWKEIVPDYKTYHGYLCRRLDEPNAPIEPIRCAIPQGQEYIGVRSSLILGQPTTDPVDYQFDYSFYDVQGGVISQGMVDLETASAEKMLFPKGGILAELSPGNLIPIYFAVPQNTAGIEVVSQQSVIFSFFATYGDRSVTEKRIPEDSDVTVINSCVQDYESPWFYVRPEDHLQMNVDGRGASVLVQNECVEEVVGGNEVKEREFSGVAVAPIRYDGKLPILEPMEIENALQVESADDSFDPMTPGKSIAVTIPPLPPAGDPDPLQIYYRCDTDAPGLQIDDERQERLVPDSRMLAYRIYDLSPGSHTLLLTGCAGGQGYFQRLAKTTVGDNIFRKRSYYKMTQGRPVRVRVRKFGWQPLYLNLVTYFNGNATKEDRYIVEAKMSSDAPDMPFGADPPPYEKQRYVFSVDGEQSGQCLRTTGCRLSARQSSYFPLNSWYPPGTYVITFELESRGEALARFFAYQPAVYDGPVRSFHRE